MKIAVFNSFSIETASNGGEIRLLNIYSRIARTHQVRLVSYDTRAKGHVNRKELSPNFEMIDVPMSETDMALFRSVDHRLGKHPHDILFVEDYELNAMLISAIKDAITWADVVVVTHPYLVNLVFPLCDPLKLRIYEAHNVEFAIKRDYFDDALDRELGVDMTRKAMLGEAKAALDADLVLAVDEGDKATLQRLYDLPDAKVCIVPNGVSVDDYARLAPDMLKAFREAAETADQDIGVFLGSAYGPNVEAYRAVREWLQTAGFRGTILVVGSIIALRDASWTKVDFTEQWLGFIDEDVKHLVLASADFALQVSVSGGGTNLKLFDYMAAGIPILANEMGRRGVKQDGWCIPVEDSADMTRLVADRQWAAPAAGQAAQRAREIARQDFDWDSIADRYLAALAA